jgi:hypothetical protein
VLVIPFTDPPDMVTPPELCPTSEDPNQVVKDMHKWLKTEGLSDLDPVSLFAEQLEKVCCSSYGLVPSY